MARPKKEETVFRGKRITVRFSDSEYETVNKYAREANLTVSEYIRKLAVGDTVTIRYDIVADMPELQRLATEFGKIGSNLNQIARYFNMGGVRSKVMQDEIHECISKIFEMREEVKKMAGDYHGSVEAHRKQK